MECIPWLRRGVGGAGWGWEETKQDKSGIESHFGLILQGAAGEYTPELSQQEAKKQGSHAAAPADSFSCRPPQEEVNSQALWFSVGECACAQAKGGWEPRGEREEDCSTGCWQVERQLWSGLSSNANSLRDFVQVSKPQFPSL